MWIMKIQISVLGMKLDFQANRISPLLSKQISRGLLAGAEGRERKELFISAQGSQEVALGKSWCMELLSAHRGIREIVPDFLSPAGSLGETVSEKGDHEGAQNICMPCIRFFFLSLHSSLSD